MPAPFRFDHAVILVADLERAISDYGALGFTVTPGGTHAGGATRNALVAFRDGSYLELLAFTRRGARWMLPALRRVGLAELAVGARTGLERRFFLLGGAGPGLIDFALTPPDVEADLARARSSGLEVEGPVPGGRIRTDGEEIAWRMGIPRTCDLPFLCEDVTPHGLRVPEGAAREHENGAAGIAGVVVAVENLEASSARYHALLAVDPELGVESGLSGSRIRVFPLEGARVVLASPIDAPAVLLRHLRRRGDGPFALRLRFDAPCPDLPPQRLHGARLEPVPA